MSTSLDGPVALLFNDETLFIVRGGRQVPQAITYVDGKPTISAASINLFRCVCNVQPISGDDLERLPEGEMTSGRITVWTQNTDRPLQVGDLTVRYGITYQCQSVDHWGNYTKASFAADETLTVFDPTTDIPFV